MYNYIKPWHKVQNYKEIYSRVVVVSGITDAESFVISSLVEPPHEHSVKADNMTKSKSPFFNFIFILLIS